MDKDINLPPLMWSIGHITGTVVTMLVVCGYWYMAIPALVISVVCGYRIHTKSVLE